MFSYDTTSVKDYVRWSAGNGRQGHASNIVSAAVYSSLPQHALLKRFVWFSLESVKMCVQMLLFLSDSIALQIKGIVQLQSQACLRSSESSLMRQKNFESDFVKLRELRSSGPTVRGSEQHSQSLILIREGRMGTSTPLTFGIGVLSHFRIAVLTYFRGHKMMKSPS